jgi:hypothetical protein
VALFQNLQDPVQRMFEIERSGKGLAKLQQSCQLLGFIGLGILHNQSYKRVCLQNTSYGIVELTSREIIGMYGDLQSSKLFKLLKPA